MEDSKAAVTSARPVFPSLLSLLPPPPPSNGDSCLSLINAWHLARRERGDVGGGGSGRGTSVREAEEKAAGIEETGGFWQRPPLKKRDGREGEDEVSW